MRNLIIRLILAFIAAVALFWFAVLQPMQNDRTAVAKAQTEQKTLIDTLSGDLDKAYETLDGLVTGLENLQKSVTGLNTEQQAQAGRLATIEKSSTEQKTDIAALKDRLDKVVADGTDTACVRDNLGAWAEVRDAGVQRMELSTGYRMHVDYYPQVGTPAVSILLHKEESAVLAGFGSAFEYSSETCTALTDDQILEEMKSYASVRHQPWNHSGLVYASLNDFLNGKAPKYNVFNLSGEKIAEFKAVLWENSSTTAVGGAGTPTPTTTNGNAQCLADVKPGNEPILGKPWRVEAGQDWVILHVWSNQDPKVAGDNDPQREYSVLLGPGDFIEVMSGGGTVSRWASSCEKNARDRFTTETSLNTAGKPNIMAKLPDNYKYILSSKLNAMKNAPTANGTTTPTTTPTVTAASNGNPTTTSAGNNATCSSPKLVSHDQQSDNKQVWKIGGDGLTWVGEVWSNFKSSGQELRRFKTDSTIQVKGGNGNAWGYPSTCTAEIQAKYDSLTKSGQPLPEVNAEYLKTYAP